jgi:hypothetical protein
MPLNANTWDIIINAVRLMGVVCLAVPAWHVNKYGRLVARLSESRVPFTNPAIHAAKKKAVEDLRSYQNKWTRWKSSLFLIGTFLVILSSLLGLLKPVLGSVVGFP